MTDSGWFVRPDCDEYIHRSDVPGLFALGARVDLGQVRKVPDPPQTENVIFDRRQARQLETRPSYDLENLLRKNAAADLDAAFGIRMQQTPRGALYLQPGSGLRSLGTLEIGSDDLEIHIDPFGIARGVWTDPNRGRRPRAITDLQLFPEVDGQPDRDRIATLMRAARSSDALFLSIGLSKPFAPTGGPRGLWLQVNSVLPVTRPAIARDG
jgi:hypothetical protein